MDKGDTYMDGDDRWNIPDDRQLALRGRLETGWSSYRGNNYSQNAKVSYNMSEEEQELVLSVLQRRELIQRQEQCRIGYLVKKLDNMKSTVKGDGTTTCLICGTKARLLKDQLHFCGNCGKMVCVKCSIEVRPPFDGCGKYYLCVLCYEDKMLWKRSGAWFYNAIPTYIMPEHDLTPNPSRMVHHRPGPGVAPGMTRSSNFIDRQRSQDSGDDMSDDSDIENSSAKAFEISDDRRSALYDIAADCQRNSVKSSGASSPRLSNIKRNSTDTNPSIAFSSADEIDHPKKDSRYSSENSLNSYTDVKPSTRDRGDRSSLSSSGSGKTEPRFGKTGSFLKMGQDNQVEVTGNNPHLKLNGHDDKSMRSDSNSSINSGGDIDAMFKSYEDKSAPEEKEYHGQFGMIKFTVQYDPNTQELLIIIDSCKGLKCAKSNDKGYVPSPYVKTVILPISPEAAKASKKRTPTMKKVVDPLFNFTIVYHGISDADIENKGIRLSVMDETSFGDNKTIGETCIPLKGLSTRPVQQFRRILESRANDETLFLDSKNTGTNPGRIELALHYLSKQEKLVVGIIRCVGLKALDPNGYSDPYVKCYLLPDPHKKTKRKTVVRKKTLNPEFNQEFQYDIAHAELAKRTLYIAVWDYDVGRSNDFIGGLTLGIDSSGDVLRHWFDTLKTADRRVIRWHNLSENCPLYND